MTGIALGLTAAILYGAADFYGGIAARRTSALTVALLSQLIGLATLAVALPFLRADATRVDVTYGLLAGVSGGLGLLLLYLALAMGPMGIVAPFAAVVPAVLPIGVGLLKSPRHSGYELAGIALALVSMSLFSNPSKGSSSATHGRRGIVAAVMAGLALGGFLALLGCAHPQAGLYPLFAAHIGSVSVLLLAAAVVRSRLWPLAGLAPIMLCGTMEIAASASFVFATHASDLAIAAVLTSRYPAVTTVMAHVVLEERLGVIHKLGTLLAVIAIVLVAL